MSQEKKKKKIIKKKSDYNNQQSYQDELDLVLQLLADAKEVENDIVKDYKQVLIKLEKLYKDEFPFYFKRGSIDMKRYQALAHSLMRGGHITQMEQTLRQMRRDLKELQNNRLMAWLILDYQMTAAATAQSVGNKNFILPIDIKKKVLEPWCEDKKTFKDRSNYIVDTLDSKLRSVLLQGIHNGWSLDKMTEELQKLTGFAAYQARRLIRTETMAIYSKATKDTYLQSGVKYVEIIGDAECGGICLDYVGQAIPLAEADVGVDLPPYHPNCACSFCAYDQFEKEN